MGTILKILKIVIFGGLQRLFTRLKYWITRTSPPLGASGLTVLCPVINGSDAGGSYSMQVRQYLETMPLHENSPMAHVPNTYLCRFYLLNDVFFEGDPAEEEHLKSKYLVFSSNYFGDMDSYVTEMWNSAKDDVEKIWKHRVSFDQVQSASDFVAYIKRCQVDNNLFFDGSNGKPLQEQLKALYLKQEFSRFVYKHQSDAPEQLQQAFQKFTQDTQPNNIVEPTWVAGASTELVKSKGA